MTIHKLRRKVYAKTVCFEDHGENIDSGFNGFSATPCPTDYPKKTFVQFDASISASEACAALDRIKEFIPESNFDRAFLLKPDKAAFLLKEEAKVDFISWEELYLLRALDT
jgi:hypothetical protein